MTEITLDLRGLKCPLPALKTRKALDAAAPGAVLLVSCTDPLAAIDLPNLARETGDTFLSRQEIAGYAVFAIRRGAR
jgi:tRNA 2-thiouridine synthesizing protein A